ncbi:MAG: hypothetical protein NWF06_05550 [Candidatus Bathyarchaeota archaeon]|nr:hypothetical protein [Candidatus Bathyarchaeum sp.]
MLLPLFGIFNPVKADTHLVTVGELYCWDSPVGGVSVGIDIRWSGAKTIYVDVGDVVSIRTQYYFRDWTDSGQSGTCVATYFMEHLWYDLDRREVYDYDWRDDTEEGLLEYTLYCNTATTHVFYLTIYVGYMGDPADYDSNTLIIVVS